MGYIASFLCDRVSIDERFCDRVYRSHHWGIVILNKSKIKKVCKMTNKV